MALPPEIQSLSEQPVVGRQGWTMGQELRFGDWHVYDVSRSVTRGGDLGILEYDQSRRRQTFSFTLVEGARSEWLGECEALLRRRRINTDVEIELQNRSALAGRFHAVADPSRYWEMKLEEAGEKPLAGSLQGPGGLRLEVVGTTRLAGTPLPSEDTAGFLIRREGRAIAAAELLNDGAVWIREDLDGAERNAVACALSALLLFEELRHTLPE